MPVLSDQLLGLGSRGSKRPRHTHRQQRKPSVEQLEARNLLTFYGGYRTVDELYADLATVAKNYPDITQLVVYGQSYSEQVGGVTTPRDDFLPGYDLLALHITNQAIAGPKPVFLLTTGIHAREISTPEVGMRFIDYLTQNYGSNADATWLVDQEDIWVVPVVNPDGHWYVELGTLPPYSGSPWYWRKNGHPNSCTTWPGSSGTSYGVDLNRNFNEHWTGPGSSTDPCSEIYRGTSVASEPETVAIQDLMESLFLHQRGPNDNDPAPDDTTGIHIDTHTSGGQILWPWGHTATPPPNSAGLGAIGRKFATYNHYRAGQTYIEEYPASGTLGSYGYSQFGIPSYTFELNSNGFLDTYSSVDGHLWPENRDAFLYAAKIARTPYMLVRGPDALQVAAGADNTELFVSGRIDDTQNGNQTVVAAEFYVDTPPWDKGAKPVSMEASDGDFDTPVEDVDGTVSTKGLDPGQHIVYVRGLEANGNWGPVSAAFFDVQQSPAIPRRGEWFAVAAGVSGRTYPGEVEILWHYDQAPVDAGIMNLTGRGGDRLDASLESSLEPVPVSGHGRAETGWTHSVRLTATTETTNRFFATEFRGLDELLPGL
jgi:hypothetical protein